jgi:hypothetical protein
MTMAWAHDIEGGVECAHIAIERIDDELAKLRRESAEQAIYAAVYAARMHRVFRSEGIVFANRSDEDVEADKGKWLVAFARQAVDEAKRAVELHREATK